MSSRRQIREQRKLKQKIRDMDFAEIERRVLAHYLDEDGGPTQEYHALPHCGVFQVPHSHAETQ